MIDCVGTISLFVEDQQRAKAFYTEKLGFELRADAELYPGSEFRWIAVAPKGAQTDVILYKPNENWEHYKGVVGKTQALTFTTADVRQTYKELKAKGVTFLTEPDEQPWGTFATLQDSEGNALLVVQPQEG